MTPAEFRTAALAIAGPQWRTALGPRIGKCRTQVWEYANGKRDVPETVAKLMRALRPPPAKSKSVNQLTKEEP